jgi:hypothetical protein
MQTGKRCNADAKQQFPLSSDSSTSTWRVFGLNQLNKTASIL